MHLPWSPLTPQVGELHLKVMCRCGLYVFLKISIFTTSWLTVNTFNPKITHCVRTCSFVVPSYLSFQSYLVVLNSQKTKTYLLKLFMKTFVVTFIYNQHLILLYRPLLTFHVAADLQLWLMIMAV